MKCQLRVLGISFVCVIAVVFARQGKVFADLNDGLIAYYPFNGSANDESGHGNHGTVHGATLTADRFGQLDRAYRFNGLDSFISASAMNLPTAARTVAMWFEADSVDIQPVLLGYGGGVCGTSFFMGLNGGHTSGYYVSSHCGAHTLIEPYAQPPINTWHHIAISTNSNGTIIYVDGAQAASNSDFISDTDVVGKDLAIGVDVSASGFAPYTDGNVGYFQGAIDDVRIYNRSLSASEVQQLYIGVGGSLTGMRAAKGKVTCRNVTTKKTVKITLLEGARSWDCEQAGLLVNPGDTIKQTMIVTGPAD
jgi:hypothetical protein